MFLIFEKFYHLSVRNIKNIFLKITPKRTQSAFDSNFRKYLNCV